MGDRTMMNGLEIQNYLQEHKIWADVWCSDIVCVSIEWGDWKHDHAYADYLMEQIGYKLIDEVETETDGSDCYSSNHYYKKIK